MSATNLIYSLFSFLLLLGSQKGRKNVSKILYTVALYILNTAALQYSQEPKFSGKYADNLSQGKIVQRFSIILGSCST